MKKYRFYVLLALLLSLSFYDGNAQSYFFKMRNPTSGPCPWNSSVRIQKLQNWEVYQTQNDRWDGPIDSSQCINFYLSGLFGKIELTDINPAKPVFVRYKFFSPSTMSLGKNLLWRTDYGGLLITGNASFLVADSTCPNQHCTNIRLGIQIPDSFGTGTDIRWHQGNFTPDPNNGGIGFCFPSEKFENQRIQELLFRIQVDAYDSSSNILVPYVYISEHWGYSTFSHLSIPDNPGSTVTEFLQGDFLMLHDGPEYPSIPHPYYVDVSLTPPPTTQKTISLILNRSDYLTGQPFTILRGDTILGGNGLRHNFVLVNGGGTICMPFIIELMFLRGNGYRHKAGQIQFQDPQSCMAFKAGSFLEVTAGAMLNYGSEGMGVLWIEEGTDIRIGRGAELRFSNRIVLDALTEDGNVHVYLPPGRKLSFTKTAHIDVRGVSANQNAKLVVHLRGGILDDSQLSAVSQTRICRVTESMPTHPLTHTNIRYQRNRPFLELRVNDELPIGMCLFNLNGKKILQQNEELKQGLYQIPLSTFGLAPGVYLLHLQSGNHSIRHKVLIR